jgi:hypothetical protein
MIDNQYLLSNASYERIFSFTFHIRNSNTSDFAAPLSRTPQYSLCIKNP